MAPVVFGSGIAAASFAALGVLPPTLLAFMAAQPQSIPDATTAGATTIRMLGDLNLVLFAVTSLTAGVFLLALGVAILRRCLAVPRWTGWLSIVAAALNAVTVWIAMTFSSYHGKAWTGIAFSAFIGFLVVVWSQASRCCAGRPPRRCSGGETVRACRRGRLRSR